MVLSPVNTQRACEQLENAVQQTDFDNLNKMQQKAEIIDSASQASVSLPEIADLKEIQRRDSTISRIVRDTRQAKLIKQLYHYSCQVCGLVLYTASGPYAEAAHIVPLGEPYNGPDTVDNILCLCPNHHVLFDYGAFSITDTLLLTGIKGKLNKNENHNISKEYLKHHRTVNITKILGT